MDESLLLKSPRAIYIVYDDDSPINLREVDEAVKARFSALLAAVPLLAKKKGLLEALPASSEVEKKAAENEARSLSALITSLTDGSAKKWYASATKGILAAYESTADAKEKHVLLKKFLKIASCFIEIHACMTPADMTGCSVCGVKDETKSDSLYCQNCGVETIKISIYKSSFRDKVKMSRNSYEDLVNFVRRMDAFEGLQKKKPPQAVYGQIDAYFVSIGRDDLTSASKTPPDKNKKRESLELLETALLKTGNSGYYKDIELISHNMWGWKLANLTSTGLRNVLVTDYIATQTIYNEIKKRDSSLNINFRLYFHLAARDYPCEISDFKTLSCEKSIRYHNECFEIMAKRTQLKFTPIPVG